MTAPSPANRGEAEIRCLTTEEGGRRGPVGDGYRGQFHYEDEPGTPCDGFQYFPGLRAGEFVPLGVTVKAEIWFPLETWESFHSKKINVGTRFRIQEGNKVVGRGVVTGLSG